MGYRTNEPDSILRETSQVLAKVFQALHGEGLSQSDVARELAIPLAELHKLVFGLVLTSLVGNGGDIAAGERPSLRLVGS
jgi:hypothetical protein